ncbi:MAG: GerMN domain-containing protein [Thermodesulfovibrionales bacterium]
MPFNKARLVWIGIFLLLFISGMTGGYIYFLGREKGSFIENGIRKEESIQDTDLSIIKVYYPVKDKLLMEERKVRRQTSTPSMASAVIEEFLKCPSIEQGCLIPEGTRLLNVYIGKDGILYTDLSDEVRRNFQGDAYGELLLLKGLYESIISNLSGIEDIKILVEGKEIESLGGHISILYPLKNTVVVASNNE